MVSEYRALRASVLRLWEKEHGPPDANFQQLMRFNESMDEALTDSIRTYSYAVEQMAVSKARHRMEALGTLSAGLGHDMANVLVPMRVCLTALTGEDLTPQTAPLVDALRRAVAHLDGLAKGLRALAMDPDNFASQQHSTVLSEWWSNAISPFTWALPQGVRLHVRGLGPQDPPLPPIRVPAHALMQAVFNLVQNAGQALGKLNKRSHSGGTPAGGNIWISAELVKSDTPEATKVKFVVRDDGPGMDAATVSRCTDAFFTTKPKDQGIGLGLFLVRSAVERHGGTLSVESKIGEGSTFTMHLPAESPQWTTHTPSSSQTADSRA